MRNQSGTVMGRFSELLGADKKPLWIEATAYAERLLAGGTVPWLRVPEFVAWHRQMQSLLRSDVVTLHVAPIAAAWLGADSTLHEQMGARHRTTYPIKTLLAHEPLRAHIVEILSGLRANYRNMPLALTIPSPRNWVGSAYLTVHGESPEIGEEEVDASGMYAADFLRAFGDIGIDLLLLEETPQSEPSSLSEISWYQPVFNVAGHYRWDVGLHLPIAAHEVGGQSGLSFVISPREVAGHVVGLAAPTGFWDEDAGSLCPTGGFVYLEVPANAQPERVLSRLATLRSQHH